MKILVCGFSGAGKSTWVKGLGQHRLETANYLVLDLDAELAKCQGIASDQLGNWIEKVGELEFRRSEEDLLLKLINENKNIIISLGGGSLNEKIANLIKQDSSGEIKLVFLDEDFAVCYERIKNDTNRLLAKKSKEELESLYMRRLSLYRTAHLIIIPKDANLIDGLDRLVHTLTNR